MARTALLAAAMLALAASVAAQIPGQCTESYMELAYVAPQTNDDPMAKCLTYMKVDLSADCEILITAVQSAGTLVPAMWSADPASLAITNYVECPSESPLVGAKLGTGDKLEAVRRAMIKALAGYVYGLDENDEYNYELEVPDLDFFDGKLMVKRVDAYNLVFIITKSTIQPTDMLHDNDITPLREVLSCAEFDHPNSNYEATALCIPNGNAQDPCPPNAYGVMVVEDGAVNAWNEKFKAFKACSWCPAGTGGDGYGCSPCQAGEFSTLSQDCQPCPVGTYSNAGSSYCIPCPTGTYADDIGFKECKQCPEDTYSWIPGARYCMRCLNGLPELCDQSADSQCRTDPVIDNEVKSSQGTHILSVGAMGANDGTCNLKSSVADADNYEIDAYTKCKNWGTDLQFAFTVYGDCSIQISPISDPSCSDPTDNSTHEYGAIQQRAYYYEDPANAGQFLISSLFDTRNVTKSLMMQVIPTGGPGLLAKWFPATIDAKEGQTNPLIKDMPGPRIPEVCNATLTVLGGSVLGNNGVNFPGWDYTLGTPVAPLTWDCPPGSYYSADEVCPLCPVGFTCPGGPIAAAKKVPCDPNTYNGMLGLSAACTACPNGTTPGTWTSYAAAEMCAVERLDLECKGNTTFSFAYDKAAQACQLCPAGMWRDYNGTSLECEPCPAGAYSAEGAATCSLCPKGQYNPVEGLPDQTSITGIPCIKCAVGSMPLKVGGEDPVTTGAGINATAALGSTYCDACPSGTILPEASDTLPCQLCAVNTYRAGDATPENNACKAVPAGYFLTDATHASITLCPAGTVSYWLGTPLVTSRVPASAEMACIACTKLDAALLALGEPVPQFAHTFAPRKGMTQCIPCPGGTVPKDNAQNQTTTCTACPNGRFRDAYTIASVCTLCGAGKEVGPSSKMDCTMCRAGTFMTALRASGNSTAANQCDDCAKNAYRPTMGATSCLSCPRGTQTTNKGNVECTACPIGYYNNLPGQDCAPAPAGTFVNTTGSFVSSPCPRGSWNNEQAQDNCNPCAPGKYSNVLGAKECKTCAAGTYSAGQATACVDCRAGYSAPAGAASCSPCKPGTYAPDAKSATCKLCPKGFQCPTNAMKKEAPCPRGTFSNKEANRLCSPCPVNTYSLGGGTPASPTAVMACVKCSPGTNTRGMVGQSKCQVIRPQVKRLLF